MRLLNCSTVFFPLGKGGDSSSAGGESKSGAGSESGATSGGSKR